MRISKTWIVIIIIILATVGYYVVKSVLKSPTEGLVSERVQKGEVLQEVSETGSVQAADNIALGFKTVGKVEGINVKVGDAVKKGQILVSIDANQLNMQLKNYQAALDVANAQYQKLLNGYTLEDIKTYQIARDSAKNDLENEYASAINTISDSYLKIYNSYTAVTTIKNNYFSGADQSSIKVQDGRDDMNVKMQSVKTSMDIAQTSRTNSDIDSAVSKTLLSLSDIYEDLRTIRIQCDTDSYYAKVSSADKTTIDTQKTNINTSIASVTTSKNNIESYKISLQKAEDNLALRKAGPRQEDVDVYLAQIKQAEADVNLYQAQIRDAYLRSPVDGKITKINVKIGEVVSANNPVINLLSLNPFQIQVYIYEQDIVNVKIGNRTKVNLVPFPKETFEGEVSSIDPAETIIDNVVYYKTTIDFSNQPEGIKSGMTADIAIQTNRKENVVRVPRNAVEVLDGKTIAQIVEKGKVQDREIVVGLEGNDYYEVLSGLTENNEIITGKR
mgnify:CR=1 FL=1